MKIFYVLILFSIIVVSCFAQGLTVIDRTNNVPNKYTPKEIEAQFGGGEIYTKGKVIWDFPIYKKFQNKYELSSFEVKLIGRWVVIDKTMKPSYQSIQFYPNKLVRIFIMNGGSYYGQWFIDKNVLIADLSYKRYYDKEGKSKLQKMEVVKVPLINVSDIDKDDYTHRPFNSLVDPNLKEKITDYVDNKSYYKSLADFDPSGAYYSLLRILDAIDTAGYPKLDDILSLKKKEYERILD